MQVEPELLQPDELLGGPRQALPSASPARRGTHPSPKLPPQARPEMALPSCPVKHCRCPSRQHQRLIVVAVVPAGNLLS